MTRPGLPTPIPVGNGPTGIAVGEGGVWVAYSLDDKVARIDPATQSVTNTIAVGRSPAGVAVGAGSVWVANSGDGTVTRIDPRTNKVQATITVGGSPQAITIADGRAWVTVDAQTIRPTDLKPSGGTLRIDAQFGVDYTDPALANFGGSWQYLYPTCAKLLNYPDKSGPAGSRLIPEVAQSLPARSADGRTYTFTIRSGFRFSPPSNEPVTAQTFKDTIERTLNPTMKSPHAQEYADIVGAAAYMRRQGAPHLRDRRARKRIDDPSPCSRPRLPLADRRASDVRCPVRHPDRSEGPADDPRGRALLRFVLHTRPRARAHRNPNYHGSRPHRLERIELAMGIPYQRALPDVEAGTADYTTLVGPGAASVRTLASQLDARYGPGSAAAKDRRQRYFVEPQLALDYFVLNTHRPLFRDVRLRQAVNYAIDRTKLARLGEPCQPLPDRPADHYLPPGMPGYRDTQVYPLTPDLAKARALAHGEAEPPSSTPATSRRAPSKPKS